MAIDLYISETAIDVELEGVIACATATGGNGTVDERQMSESQPGTPSEMSMTIANGVDDAVVMRFGFDPPDNYSWDSGTWSIYLGNVTTADLITLTGVWICHVNSAGSGIGTLGSNQSLNISLNSTGPVNSGNPINVTVSGVIPSAGDQILVNFVADNVASHGGVTAGITFSGATPWSATFTPTQSVSPNPLSLSISAVAPIGMSIEDVFPSSVSVTTSIPAPTASTTGYKEFYIDTDSGSSGNGGTSWADAWDSLVTGESSINGYDLVTNDQIGRIWCRGATADAAVDLNPTSGYTDATHYWEIHGEGAETSWNSSLYHIDNTTEYDGIDIQAGYFRIYDIQIKSANTTATFTTCIQHAGAGVLYVERAYLWADVENSSTNSIEGIRNQGGGTVYGMCKAVDRGIYIGDVCLLHKSNGRSGECDSGQEKPASD